MAPQNPLLETDKLKLTPTIDADGTTQTSGLGSDLTQISLTHTATPTTHLHTEDRVDTPVLVRHTDYTTTAHITPTSTTHCTLHTTPTPQLQTTTPISTTHTTPTPQLQTTTPISTTHTTPTPHLQTTTPISTTHTTPTTQLQTTPPISTTHTTPTPQLQTTPPISTTHTTPTPQLQTTTPISTTHTTPTPQLQTIPSTTHTTPTPHLHTTHPYIRGADSNVNIDLVPSPYTQRNVHSSSNQVTHTDFVDTPTHTPAVSVSDVLHTHLQLSPSSVYITGAHTASMIKTHTDALTHTDTLTHNTTHTDTHTPNTTPNTTPTHTPNTTPTHTHHITDTFPDSGTPIVIHACTTTPTLLSSTPTPRLSSSSTHTLTDPTPSLTEPTTTFTAKCVTAKPHDTTTTEEDVPEEKLLLLEGTRGGVQKPCLCRSHALSPDVDGGWAWVVFVAGFLQFFISSAMYYSFSVYYVELVHAFGEPRAKTGWVYSTNSAMHMFCGPLGGWTISRWGPRAAVMIGGLLACLGYIGSAFSPSLNIIFFTYGVVNGVGTSLNFSGWVVGLGRFWRRRRSWVTGLAMAGSGVGVALLGPTVSLLVSHYGWRGAMILSAGLSLNFCVLGATIISTLAPPPPHKTGDHCHCRLLRKGEEGQSDDDETEMEVSSALPPSLAVAGSMFSLDQAKTGQGRKSAKEVAMWPGFWLLQGSCFLSFMATTTIFALLLDWVEWAGLASAFSGALAGSGAGDVAGRVAAGLLCGRGPPLLLFSGMQLLLAVVVTCAAMATTPLQFVAAMVGVGMACGLQSVLHALLPSQLSSEAGVGHLLGWQLVVAGLGALAGPPLAGFLVDLTHSYLPTIALCTVAPATASLLSLAAHCITPPLTKPSTK
ncbi:hypothetical protein Pcinc_023180 [Petrolisthes cinctipes]|uniref:Major facilitator superfamily (MFS) profile domain-containing protein n=1 Tax=Petrolisthes cinctipes TaxID=88211 RepID=A0AAE1FD26_PETCI|nr:hypothetical protein Pcinc_023180 [Petrolisthes cinctipes]